MLFKANVLIVSVIFQYFLFFIMISGLVNSKTTSSNITLPGYNLEVLAIKENSTLEIMAVKNNSKTIILENKIDEYKSEGQSCLVEADMFLSAPELIRKKGYPFESHHTVTSDGYILELHRIPAAGRTVVVAFHGMTLSSRDFLLNCENKAFGFKMFDAGFDVWLANIRGNLYSQKHTYLHIKEKEFWNFTVEDAIKFDVPAIIDYILKVTGKKKLHWVGYSLGTSLALGLGSFHPEYYKKIDLIFMMGTTAYVGNSKSPLLRTIAPSAQLQDIAMTHLNYGELLPPTMYPALRKILPLVCLSEAKLEILGFCIHFLFLVDGVPSNPTILPMMLGGIPGPVGIKMLCQWYQWVNTGNFSYYDFGRSVNLEKYKSPRPPNYDLAKATGRFVNMWAQKDLLSVPQDVHRVVRELPNVVMNIKIKKETWNHLDFAYGKDADIYVYDEIIATINKFSLFT